MKATKYLLIGGGLAAHQAARTLREQDGRGAIVLVGDEPHVPYDRPPLSKEFLRGEKPREQLLFDPESYFAEHGIELHLGGGVRRLDVAGKSVALENGETMTFEKALIATGGRPVHLNLPGGELPGVHYLRTLDDAAAIAAEAGPGRRAVLVGAGFIGLEAAASLAQKGVRATVIEAQPRIWARFADESLADFFQSYCAERGVTFLTGETVAEIRGRERVQAIVTRSGQELPGDFVLIAVGIIPNVELAREAGLAVENGIVVDEYLETSHPDFYAAGDVASYVDPIFEKRRRVEHWGHAEYTGQLAGQNMAGGRAPYDLLTYVWSDIFDLHLEFAGDESEHDRVLLRGGMEDKAFTMLFLKDHTLRAYFAINTGAKEFPALRRLIRNKTNLAGKEAELQDPGFALKGLR